MYFEIFYVTNMKNVYIYFKWIHKVKAKGQHAIQRKKLQCLRLRQSEFCNG